MKHVRVFLFLACGACLTLASLPVQAQNGHVAQPHPNAVPDADARPTALMPMAPSITMHLQMQGGQIAQLGQLYDDYAARRRQQEAKIVQWQSQLRLAQSPTSFDQNQAARLSRNINAARQSITSDFLTTRGKALKILSPVQRAQLESIATDSRLRVQDDRFFELLLLPVENLWQRSFDGSSEAVPYEQRMPRNQRARDHGSGNYGVYGGYHYGYPDYGVYGNYGQGGVGVHVGIGRGGPSIGVGIGRVFGGIFGRR